MIAAWRGHSSIVAELVRAGAQIDALDQVYNLYICIIVFGFLVTQDLLHAHVPPWKHPVNIGMKFQKFKN